VHADAEFAGDPNDLRSTSGMLLWTGTGAVIGWRSTKHPVSARTTADFEYTAVAMAVDKALWLSKIETEIYGDQSTTLHVRNDNNIAIVSILSGMYKASNRHIAVKYRWLRELCTDQQIEVSYIDIANMRADVMTQPLERARPDWLMMLLGMRCAEEWADADDVQV
jgi:ribonuclease HI